MANFNISIELSDLSEVRRLIDRTVYPLVSQGINGIAQATVSRWIEAVQHAKLWSGEKDAYAKTITYSMTSDMSAVVESTYKYASEIEEGRPPRDLKKMLDTSNKVRRTKDGTRFLVIPFRHNVSSMPAHVYSAASALTASTIIGQTKRRAGELTSAAFGQGMVPMSEKRQRRNPFLKSTANRQDVMVNKDIYSWGSKLVAGSMGPNPRGKSDRFAGMVKFDTSTPGAQRSSFLTFRIMSEKSQGWIVPAQPGQHIVKGVVDEMKPMAEKIIQEAFKRS
jgi:hypothetical protein